MSQDNFVKVTIFGNEYRVRGNAPEEEIQEIADYVDNVMKNISQSGRHSSEARVAILAAFNIAANWFASRKAGQVEAVSEEKAAHLLKLLDNDLFETDEGVDLDT
ncbi:MAG: cell division protein ZapA [bacterium]|nr:cell division protein ZapA [bacterium]